MTITCLLHFCRRHNVNAWFVNMVFSDKHKILTKKNYTSWRDCEQQHVVDNVIWVLY